MDVRLLYVHGCPNWTIAEQRLRGLAEELDLTVAHEVVASREQAEHLGFRGSPTILVDGRDPFARGDEPTGLACRIYDTPEGPAGSPTTRQLRAALT